MVTMNSASDTLISGTSDGDTITNSGSNVTIDSGDGNDYIYCYPETSEANINTDSVNDTVHISADNSKVTVVLRDIF